jgi:recombination protein RecR
MTNSPSKLLDNAVYEFSKLPGIGKRTALRLVLHLLRKTEEDVTIFGQSVIDLRKNIKRCKICNNISDTDICNICSTPSRDPSTVCVVENITEVIAVENTAQFHGLYHVLGGLISPMDGIGPADLDFDGLIRRVAEGEIKEIILALSATPEGDTTNFYIYRKLGNLPVIITTLARGVAIGDELEYADQITLGRSITNRIKFEAT